MRPQQHTSHGVAPRESPDRPQGARRWRWFLLVALLVVVAGMAVARFARRADVPPTAETTPQVAEIDLQVPTPNREGMEPRVRDRIRQARQAVLDAPQSAQAWGRLGEVYDAHELYDVAATCYRQAHTLDPRDFRWPYFLAAVLDAVGTDAAELTGLLEKAIELRPRYTPARVRLADTLLEIGELAEARDAYVEATRLDAELAPAYRGLGQVLLTLGRPDEAVRQLERAAELNPEHGATFAALAQAYMRTGQREQAQEVAERSRDLPRVPDLPDPARGEVAALGIGSGSCMRRARALMDRGRFQEAISNLKIVEEVEPDGLEVHSRLGEAYSRVWRPALARRHLNRALELKPDQPDIYVRLGELAMYERRLEEAVGHFRRALRDKQDDAVVRALLAVALARRGQLSEAIAQFERAAALGSLDAQACYNWGNALRQQGHRAQAVERYREAIRLDPDHVSAHYNLAMVLEALGQLEEAQDHYRTVLRLNPNHRSAERIRALGGLAP